MSAQLDSILARSRSPGRFVERKRFTLSREKAVEKLREFSLRRPEQYILELVQAAVFAGARWIAIDISAERLFFAWVGGKSFTSSELEHVFDYLFADRAAAETRHVVQLAVALNALLQRKPKVLRIESGDGSSDGTVRMDLDKHGKGHLGQPEEAFQGTYLVVEYATNWFARFQGSDWTREQGLVEERCMYTPVPILLNYRAPFGYRANKEIHLYGVSQQQRFVNEGRRGVLGLPGSTTKVDGIRLVVGGVWVSTKKIAELGMVPLRQAEPEPLVGVVCDDRLRKTADQSDVVEDGRFVDMLHAVQPVATTLIKRSVHGAGYKPPALPRRVVEASPLAASDAEAGPGPSGPTPEPLPEEIPQVAPRPTLVVEDLAALSGGTPVFWVDPDTARSLGTAGDPERFPFRLLVLTAGQALTLGEEAPALSVAPITSAADAEFVGRVFARQARIDEIAVPVRSTDGLGGRGTLRLRLHHSGTRPAWGADELEDVPVSVRVARRASWCGGLHLGLPGISALLELDAGSFDLAQGPVALTHLVRKEAWRLLEAHGKPGAGARLPDAPVRALAVALLAMQASPHVYDGPTGPDLALTLPRDWSPSLRSQVRSLPLARPLDPAAPPLSLDGFLQLLGQDEPRTLRLASTAELALLQPLEQRLGAGHLLPPDPDPRPVLAVALVGDGAMARWIQWSPSHVAPGPHLRAVLWLGQDLDPQLPSSRWRMVARPAPGVVLAVRADLPEGEGVVRLRDGLSVLRNHLGTVVREDLWADSLPQGVEVERARQLGRLALIGLALEDADTDERVMARSDGSGWLRLDALTEDQRAPGQSRARVALRHGPRVVEPDTVLLSWDEICALHGRRHPVPLRFDDPPEVWTSLVQDDAPQAQPAGADSDTTPGWLLRERLRVPGLDGWLGLRAPYDPTSVVLIQQSGELVALTHIDRHVPCHGMAWTLGASDSLSRVQRDLLELARLRLYQRLAERLGQGASALGQEAERAWRDTAECYAIDFAVHAWRAGGGEGLTGTSARLLDGLRLSDTEGRPLGTLRSWLTRSPDQRAAPRGHAARYRTVTAEQGERAPRGDYEEALQYLERRLQRALALASQDPALRVHLHRWEGGPKSRPVRVRDEGSGHGSVSLELNEHHPVVYSGLAEAGDGREILLLESARVAASVVREAGGTLDLLHVHQLLAAQRL